MFKIFKGTCCKFCHSNKFLLVECFYFFFTRIYSVVLRNALKIKIANFRQGFNPEHQPNIIKHHRRNFREAKFFRSHFFVYCLFFFSISIRFASNFFGRGLLLALRGLSRICALSCWSPYIRKCIATPYRLRG